MQNRQLSTFIGFRFAFVVLVLVTPAILGLAHVGPAQMGSGSPPATYDYNDMVPGVQGPTSPLVANPIGRFVRTYTVQIPVLVPLSELLAALPPGFVVSATPANSTTGSVTLSFYFQERHTRLADGQTVGASAMLPTVTVTNTNLTPNRTETGLFAYEGSTQEWVDFRNATYGPGTARLAKVSMQLTEDGGVLSFKSTVTDSGLGLNISAQATCPSPIANRTKNDPVATPFRNFNSMQSLWAAQQRDDATVPLAMANVKVDTPDGKLRVSVAPTGGSRSLTISGIGPNITFMRNQEFFVKIE